jgi:hypothetical protein
MVYGTLYSTEVIEKGMSHPLVFLSNFNSLEKLRPRIFL